MSKYLAGIDVGSTTTKVVVCSEDNKEIIFSEYKRHNASQFSSVKRVFSLLKEKFGDEPVRFVLTGSGAKPIADYLGLPFIQEVVANSIALRSTYSDVGTAIELGGQDAKMIFFKKDEKGVLQISDMRMNGSCAGGTGAFIDEVASILRVPVEEINSMAAAGTTVYDISGRCGVYAKTDIQPLLNQGVSTEDLALSAFHAIAKQTIGGLAQGLDITPPVVFEGGPLTFNPSLIGVFRERLNLTREDTVIPDHPEIMIAYGAALSLLSLFTDTQAHTPRELLEIFETKPADEYRQSVRGQLYFESEEEKEDFYKRHPLKTFEWKAPERGATVRGYLGIDSGSTTTKFVLMSEDEEILDVFYASNRGDPLTVAKKALTDMKKRYDKAGVKLEIIAAGSTGYGELLFSKAFSTEYHVVETVAHAKAAAKYVDDATFILDIGGQDMKAIWLDHGIITNILVNEACSSGCGSFLENFAASLNIPVENIAKEAFDSKNPASLGSRCTVFMNSSIITEQRNGKLPGDIMSGLCRSIIENVFTKVIRISNVSSLGDKIVVQGGTFRNDAVLRAMEQYIGKDVIRPPYPGIMGAMGVCLLLKEQHLRGKLTPSFIGFDAIEKFEYTQESNLVCPFCTNHCKRTIVRFSNGNSWVTNNRCERGEIIGDIKDPKVARLLREKSRKDNVPDMFKTREELLFKEYPCIPVCRDRGIRIGMPKVLNFWELMPFWSTFFRALGFKVLMSPASTRAMYEEGLYAVTSDTVCFPAKLVHGHIHWLAKHGADRIFMPSVATMHSENTSETSESMCAVVKGYPIVIRNSDNPEKKWNIPYDTPLFYWYTEEDKNTQLKKFMKDTFGIDEKDTQLAVNQANTAMNLFRDTLREKGQEIIEKAEKENSFAVVLASRPYQNDGLVNHGLPEMFTKMGIPVLTADSVPGIDKVDLSNSRIEVVNNYHARMLASAVIAAQSRNLEYVQIVSFGCGHDAYLSDEIIRMMREISGKTPLVLKLDESDVQGPLRIRVRSFVETVAGKHERNEKLTVKRLDDAYPVKFTKEDVKDKVVLIPNTSHAFSRIMSAALKGQHLRAEPLPVGRERAIYFGKKFVHNDICFPAQITIGEALAALDSGNYDVNHTAIGMGKYLGDCRLTHYTALLRKALDDAGYSQVPIITNDSEDAHNIHPGFKMNLLSSVRLCFALPMIDFMEELLRKIRPYELEKGSADEAFEKGMDCIVEGLEKSGISGAGKGFEKAVDIMDAVPYDRSHIKPQVLIVGEYLLNFHPGANHEIERYLEDNGFEIVEAKMTDVIRKSYYALDRQIREYHLHRDAGKKIMYFTCDEIFNLAHDMTDRIASRSPLYDGPQARIQDIVKGSDGVIHHTFDAGEGVLIPAEIIHHALAGCRNFIILQPFGCLPNHVVGRGIAKKLKEMFPDVQILPLDYDPDVSFANIENRLQMLIMNAKAQ